MNPGITMNPDIVYQLVASNPSLRKLVEQSAYLLNMQQQAQQVAPALNQFAVNPVDALNGYAQWQNQQAQPQNQPPAQQQEQQPQEGVGAVNYLQQAEEAIANIMTAIECVNDNIKGLYDEIEGIKKKLDEIIGE